MDKNLLTLTNNKRRVIFHAEYDEYGYRMDYENGHGSGPYGQETNMYLSAACAWADAPSCKVTGSLAEPFMDYCRGQSWAVHLVPS